MASEWRLFERLPTNVWISQNIPEYPRISRRPCPMILCALGAFLPSIPGRARDAHPQIKTPPACAAAPRVCVRSTRALYWAKISYQDRDSEENLHSDIRATEHPPEGRFFWFRALSIEHTSKQHPGVCSSAEHPVEQDGTVVRWISGYVRPCSPAAKRPRRP